MNQWICDSNKQCFPIIFSIKWNNKTSKHPRGVRTDKGHRWLQACLGYFEFSSPITKGSQHLSVRQLQANFCTKVRHDSEERRSPTRAAWHMLAGAAAALIMSRSKQSGIKERSRHSRFSPMTPDYKTPSGLRCFSLTWNKKKNTGRNKGEDGEKESERSVTEHPFSPQRRVTG